jgi:multidrug efflux pump subunit AcrA (membrane-fusion protein)
MTVESREGVVVPDSAVMDTGLRKIVFVSPSSGRVLPREVTVGMSTGGKVLVESGLSDGENVAVSASFLLDSESRLRSAIAAPAGDGN